MNYRCCFRLFGEWEVTDRSWDMSSHQPPHDDLADAVISALADSSQFDADCGDQIASPKCAKLSRIPVELARPIVVAVVPTSRQFERAEHELHPL
jgi:hypothetical protein